MAIGGHCVGAQDNFEPITEIVPIPSSTLHYTFYFASMFVIFAFVAILKELLEYKIIKYKRWKKKFHGYFCSPRVSGKLINFRLNRFRRSRALSATFFRRHRSYNPSIGRFTHMKFRLNRLLNRRFGHGHFVGILSKSQNSKFRK